MRETIAQLALLIVAIVTLFGCSTKAPVAPDRVEQGDYTYLKEYMRWYIEKEMQSEDIVGLSIALIDDQKIIWSEGFGYADRELNIKATPHTRYRAGSITKLFNAMAVMKLVEQHKIDLDRPLVTYLPQFSIKSRFGSTDDITPRNILTHHSGLPSNWLDRMFATDPIRYDQIVDKITDTYVAYPPDTIFDYSNLAITLLGHSVELVSQQPYTTFLQQSLLLPLHMSNSDLDTRLKGEMASKSYSDNEEIDEYAIGQIPAGALNTTTLDLAKFAMMINNKGAFRGKTVLKSATLKEMFCVQNSNIKLDLGQKMGLGWFIDDKILPDKQMLYWHSGATVAHMSSFMIAPESKLAVIVMANSDSSDSTKIAKIALQKAWELKMNQKLSFTKESVSSADFEDTYATVAGKVNFIKKSDKHYVAKASNKSFDLTLKRDGGFMIEYLLFGFIPIGEDTLGTLTLYAKDIDGSHILAIEKDHHNYLIGIKATPKQIPDIWHNRLGAYELLNNFEPKRFKIQELNLEIEDGFLVAKIQSHYGDEIVEILDIINDNEVIIDGIGISKRETIRIKELEDGSTLLLYQGLIFRSKQKNQ